MIYIDASQDEIEIEVGPFAGYLKNGLGLSQSEVEETREMLNDS